MHWQKTVGSAFMTRGPSGIRIRGVGFEPTEPSGLSGLSIRCFRPLSHPSSYHTQPLVFSDGESTIRTAHVSRLGSYIQIAHKFRILFNKESARFDIISHQPLESIIRENRVL